MSTCCILERHVKEESNLMRHVLPVQGESEGNLSTILGGSKANLAACEVSISRLESVGGQKLELACVLIDRSVAV